MSERMPQISLRAFRTMIAEIGAPTEVSRRDSAGNIQVLGFWTPYMTYPMPTGPSIRLELPVDEPEPKFITSPDEVAAVVRRDPVRAVPKPSQTKAKR